ncbi:MAG: hypothetical protein ACXABY_11215 [Candidatus Thorarchaeota archaeon]|jgi:hypothetical protein
MMKVDTFMAMNNANYRALWLDPISTSTRLQRLRGIEVDEDHDYALEVAPEYWRPDLDTKTDD